MFQKKVTLVLNTKVQSVVFSLNKTIVLEKEIYKGRIIQRKALSPEDKDMACYHVTIQSETEVPDCLPGDSIEFLPKNQEWLAEAVLEKLDILPDKIISDERTIRELLIDRLEISRLSYRMIRDYAKISGSGKVQELLKDTKALSQYMTYANVLDLLSDYYFPLTSRQLAEWLPGIRYRQYSVASYLKDDKTKIDLVAKTIRFDMKNRRHEGAASVYMNEFLALDQSLKFRVYKSPSFRLPEDDEAPVIMIAAGTGIAPFRGFLQQMRANGIKRKTWLIFGEKNRVHDFYFESEFENYLKAGELTKLDVAFSRDQEEKRYVQHVLKEHKSILIQWIADGAHVSVCGSMQMGKDVKNSINTILKKPSNQSALSSTSVSGLFSANRYHEDIY